MTGRLVTAAGMRLRGMRLLVHRGQVVLLLVVGILAGVAVAGVGLELCGVSVLGALRVNELFVEQRSPLPSRIVISGPAAPSRDSVLAGAAASNPDPALARRPSPDGVQATATTSVVRGAVYTYPPDGQHGGGPGPGPSPGGEQDSGGGGRAGRGG